MIFGTQNQAFFPEDLVEKFNLLLEMGFETFEVDGRFLLDNTQAVKTAAEKTGMKVWTACGGPRGFIGDFIEERRLHAVDDIKLMLEALHAVGGRGMVIPAALGMFTYRLPPMVSPRSKEGDRKAILDSLSAIEPEAIKLDMQIYLEPLNRYQDHMLNTLKDAREIIDAGGFKNVKIIGDIYHMNIDEDDISEAFEQQRDFLAHVHIADNHRYQPGTGHIDFKRHFDTLKKIGYEGAVVYEGRVRGENPLEEYRKSIKLMKEISK